MFRLALTTFFAGEMDFVFFFYGLSFIIMGTICLALWRREKGKIPWFWLGLFALAHGLNEFASLGKILFEPNYDFLLPRLILLPLSFLLLFEFGRSYFFPYSRWLTARIVYPALSLLIGLGLLAGVGQYQANARYFAGLPAAAMAVLAIWRIAAGQKTAPKRTILRAMALFVAAYGLTTGVVVNPAPLFPASRLNHDVFLAATGIPIQMVRALLAFAMAMAVLRWFYHVQQQELASAGVLVRRRRQLWLVPALAVVLISGWIFAHHMGRVGRVALEHNLIATAETAAAALDKENILRLTGSRDDLTRPEYRRSRAALHEIIMMAERHIRFAYLMQRRDGKVYFLADAESSPEVEAKMRQAPALPGDRYLEATPVLIQAFDANRTLVEGPISDKWGTFISALTPIRLKPGKEAVAILGLDMDVGDWQSIIQSNRIEPLLITLVVSLLLISFFVVLEWTEEINARVRASESKYQMLFGTMASGFAYCRLETEPLGQPLDYTYLEVNHSFEKILGVKRQQVIGRRGSEFFPDTQEPGSRFIEAFAAAAVEGRPSRFEEFSKSRQRWYDLAVYGPQRGYFAFTFIDVTEQRQLEERKKENQQLLQRIMDAMPNPVFYKDTLGRYLGCNLAFEKYLGRDREEIIGHTVFDLVPVEQAKIMHSMDVELLLKPGTQSYETKLNTPLGADRDVLFTKATYADATGRPAGLVGVMLDITEMRLSEQRLGWLNSTMLSFGPDPQANINQLAALCGELFKPDWVTYRRLQGKTMVTIAQWNTPPEYPKEEAAEGTFGYDLILKKSSQIFVQQNLPDTPYAATSSRIRQYGLRTFFSRAIQVGPETVGVLNLAYRRDYIPSDAERNLLEIIASAVGIEEERLAAVEERQQLEERLHQVQKQQSLATLAGGFAHDFNNLLMVILGNANMAKSTPGLDPMVKESLVAVEQASKKAALVISQMLAYAGKEGTPSSRLHLSGLLRNLSHLLEVNLPPRVQMKMEMADDLPAVQGDEQALRQVVFSLVNNAVEAIGEKGGVVKVATKVAHLGETDVTDLQPVGSLNPGRYVALEVVDNGCGMDATTLARIFDPFYSTKFTGRGLGLAAVLGTVKAHRGAIRVQSQPGLGTTFNLFFPIAS